MALRKITIQVFSDIHLELWNNIPQIIPKAKYLFLAGDICQLNNKYFYPFLDYCSSNWEKVFYTPGNHEYYSKKRNFNELEFEYNYRIGEKYKNIFYLNNKVIPLDEEINVYGTTFWTIPQFESTYKAKQYLNDYHQISYFSKDLNKVVDLDIGYVKSLAEESYTMLNKYLKENDKPTIIMTHFPPQRNNTSAPKYLALDREQDKYFSWPNGTLENLKLDNVMAWISGHTHWSYNFESNGINLISNQLGYRTEIGRTGLNEDGLYEITIS